MRMMLVLVMTMAAGCATGPRRQTVGEYVQSPAPGAQPQEGAINIRGECLRPLAAPPDASPFSAGLMLGAGLHLRTGKILPTQLAIGSLKVNEVAGRGLNLLALGGVSQTDVSSARLSWGFGAGLQLTPEPLAYEVDASLGLLWLKGERGPAAVVGFTLTPKM